jgi:predicted transposase YbfD/YdcC
LRRLEAQTLFESLSIIKDPRVEARCDHKLLDILMIAICSYICGADSWEDIEEFGKSKQEWFASFLELPNGIPSHYTFRRVFILMDSDELKEHFLEWIKSAIKMSKGQLVNIDGKVLRGSKHRSDGKGALNIVSAWSSEQSVVLGQVKTDEKSNEITAIPELLKMLDLEGCIVTIDAMGCQTEIVKDIVKKKADYVISLKGNQGTLYEDVKDYLDWAERIGFDGIEYDYYETLEKGHGRIEHRRCWVTSQIEWLEGKEGWAKLRTIAMVECEREIIGGEKTVQRRYFISSLKPQAEQILRSVRGHWGIENKLHWCLDIGFREDECRTRTGNAGENLAIIRHIALNLLKQEKTCKQGIKSKRLKAGWDENYMLKVLNF